MFGKVGSYGGDTTRRLMQPTQSRSKFTLNLTRCVVPTLNLNGSLKTWEKESESVTEYSNKSYIVINEVNVLGNSSCELLLQFNSYNAIIFINMIFMY
ncbi:hypothetical protein TorRG33x02_317410 [Trema orientale]|uniref:Uncharacterized protein n=1 Tax=Trema orientale TaxID=63057 RepID=A0A2P5BL76_TREOI|nr:hypothetical protein TorRG33x02_317410 [Trema orientale]